MGIDRVIMVGAVPQATEMFSTSGGDHPNAAGSAIGGRRVSDRTVRGLGSNARWYTQVEVEFLVDADGILSRPGGGSGCQMDARGLVVPMRLRKPAILANWPREFA